jgi:hypothetical protein
VQVPPLDAANVNVSLAYAINSLYWGALSNWPSWLFSRPHLINNRMQRILVHKAAPRRITQSRKSWCVPRCCVLSLQQPAAISI